VSATLLLHPRKQQNFLLLVVLRHRPNTDPLPVARIAYVSSDVVISVQPSLDQDSEFSAHLRSFLDGKAPSLVAKGVPEVCIFGVWMAQNIQY
jgi:hypothetical protein